MSDKKRTRNANGRSSIYQDARGVWHGWVSVGMKDNGKPDRRHREAKTRTAVVAKVRELERERDNGAVRKAGSSWNVDKWLLHWLEAVVAPPAITENAYDAYEVAVRVHLIPGVGAHRLDRLEAEHLERLYRKLIRGGSAPARVHQIHRTVNAALGEAARRGHILKNPATLARAPQVEEKEAEPYNVEQVKRILAAAKEEPNGTRWAIALALGLRQGEALGLKWERVDFDTRIVWIHRNRLRPKYAHGCGGTCGKRVAGYCPLRRQTRPDVAKTKSKAGTRPVGIPDEIVELLKAHREQQERDRAAAAELWEDTGFVFTTAVGRPINPSTDYHAWKRLIGKAGVPDRRLHDARHTAATVLLLLGVPERTVMSLMGWASTAMAARYQHVGGEIRRGVASQIGGLLWQAGESESKGGGRADNA